MTFKEKFDELIKIVEEKADYLETEENTNQFVVVPFFQLLGYKTNQIIFNIQFGDYSNDKLDIGIYKNDKIITFIKTFKFRTKLDHFKYKKISEQFNQYKKHENINFCVLTNGYEYKFYSDYYIYFLI